MFYPLSHSTPLTVGNGPEAVLWAENRMEMKDSLTTVSCQGSSPWQRHWTQFFDTSSMVDSEGRWDIRALTKLLYSKLPTSLWIDIDYKMWRKWSMRDLIARTEPRSCINTTAICVLWSDYILDLVPLDLFLEQCVFTTFRSVIVFILCETWHH